ncbi:MAG: 50S ribosome-binding GTPase [Acinetobacter sp.]
MDIRRFDQASQIILTVVPEHNILFSRLRELLKAENIPTVTVVGKYNHGKSRLLNALIGEDIFSVADKRETTVLSEHIKQHIRWLDAPGLDADVDRQDDQHAQNAIWTKADIRLFIHSLKEGELDPLEIDLFDQLQQDQQITQRQTLVVLTQLDQIQDAEVLSHIIKHIQIQIPSATLLAVSASRYNKGINEAKPILLNRSGIPELRHALAQQLEQVPRIRTHEKSLIFSHTKTSLLILQTQVQTQLQQLRIQQQQQREAFDRDLNQVLDKICKDLSPVMQVSGQDLSLEPDSFANMYKVTAGKLDRNRIQVAYSRACIDLNSHLIRYGVVGLPNAQKTFVRSLDTVIMAVLGISVKRRKDLDYIFLQASGRERLRHEFTYYFEQSSERQGSQAKLLQLKQRKSAIEAALLELNDLDINL